MFFAKSDLIAIFSYFSYYFGEYSAIRTDINVRQNHMTLSICQDGFMPVVERTGTGTGTGTRY